ncbi:hypothetical protein [Pseudonocardia acidicola]|uniref:Uncharacterized protein n=1 Tax=Pseudonocardia acidicola TaxID=2724939 RepID=A0ABX1SJ93_9PSEU|nr:hypothetical protein [Pseudonocardia acidicola]NMI01650.1 hypothetical protein [Pseudonocardia acidicola]
MGERPQCALPGCDRVVPASDAGRPPRRYCSPEHHAQARPVAGGSGRSRMDSLTALSGLPPTSTRHRSGAGRPMASARDVANLRDQLAARAARSRRQRLVAVVGVAGVLVAGAGWFGVDKVIEHLDPAYAPRTVQPATWTTQAQVTLASINKQLDTIAQTKVVWESRIAPRYRGTVPTQVSQMLDREALLEQQKAAIESQLATARQVGQVHSQLTDLGRQLEAIESTLDELPPGNLSPDQALVLQALQNRRDLLQQDRQAKQAELTRLEQGVQAAERTPLPAPADQTTPVTRAVLDLDKHGPGRPKPDGPPQPEVLAAGRDDRRHQQTATTSQPLDPRKEPIPDRSNMGPDGKPTDTVTTAVRDVGSSARDAVGGVGNAAKDTVGGVRNAANDTVGAIGHALSGGGSGGGDGSRSESGSGSGGGGSRSEPTPSGSAGTVESTVDTVTTPVREVAGQGSSSAPSSSSRSGSSNSRSTPGDNAGSGVGASGGSSVEQQLRIARQVVDAVPGMAFTPADAAISSAEQTYNSGGSSSSSPGGDSSPAGGNSSSGGGSGASAGSGM